MKTFTTIVYIMLIAAILYLFFSCKESKKVMPDTNIPSSIVVIDSCEYIYFNGGIAHMGNCQYCKQRSIKLI